ncbi:hypothetical protein BGZ96_004008 [Linnemannia gamsii]|uniref:Uncharacterized protein n=1 Tax=Linnemannia gamsii TaxID=64522 RepID=A0ABQ7JIM0_9FUNG|nr:hypothetical protein BGZ96_004008 [Linnemannia gamsii]
MSEKEFAQRRKESARAVLDSILTDLNASSTVKQYQNHIFKWKEEEQEQEEEEEEQEQGQEQEENMCPSDLVPPWTPLKPPTNVDPVEWHSKLLAPTELL